MRRVGAITVLAALAAAGWGLRLPIRQYLLGGSPHPFGAAEVLATVTHHTSPTERAHRMVLACAHENDARACEEAFRQALTIARPDVVASWLKEKEIEALRFNSYFEQYASDLKNYSDRVSASWRGTGTSTKMNLWMPSETPLDLSPARQADSLRPAQQSPLEPTREESSVERVSRRPE
ncbi:MAG: hypothetical protein HZA88_08165 [Verrucomicrobia bacterium]|nr:hypothetical protein [Verrucomicrobiota bacterium]